MNVVKMYPGLPEWASTRGCPPDLDAETVFRHLVAAVEEGRERFEAAMRDTVERQGVPPGRIAEDVVNAAAQEAYLAMVAVSGVGIAFKEREWNDLEAAFVAQMKTWFDVNMSVSWPWHDLDADRYVINAIKDMPGAAVAAVKGPDALERWFLDECERQGREGGPLSGMEGVARRDVDWDAVADGSWVDGEDLEEGDVPAADVAQGPRDGGWGL